MESKPEKSRASLERADDIAGFSVRFLLNQIIATCRKSICLRTMDKTDQHVTEILRSKTDHQAWNVLSEASRHDDPAIKTIADEKYSARVIDQLPRPGPSGPRTIPCFRQSVRLRWMIEAMFLTSKQAFLRVRKNKDGCSWQFIETTNDQPIQSG